MEKICKNCIFYDEDAKECDLIGDVEPTDTCEEWEQAFGDIEVG